MSTSQTTPSASSRHAAALKAPSAIKLAASVMAAALFVSGCGSSNSDEKATSTTAATKTATSDTSPAGSDTKGSGTTDDTSASDKNDNATSSGSDLPDPCSLLTTADMNTVLVGADEGTRQLSGCTWTDPEGTAARLVLNKPTQGTPLDTSQGSPLDGVGDEAIIATAPGTVRIIARAKGLEVAFSVDTGTSDIKPNQANATKLVTKVIDALP